MSIASVAHKYAFGLKSDVRGNLHWLDDTTVVYPCGANTILYQLETRTQRFLPMQEGFEAITSMALAPNKRYLAISETGMVNSTMVIYDMQTLRKRKTLSGNEAEIKGYLNMMFSGDSKYLVSIVQTKANESLVQLWSWEKAKVMASIKCSVTLCHQVLFNPWDSTQVSVVGPTVFKCYRFVEGTMKQFGNQKLELKSNFCHLWISDVRTLVACGEGRLMIFENGEYKTEMVNTYGPTNTPKEVYAMTLHSRGFICGCQGGGVTIYERYDEFTFKKVKEFSVPDDCLSDITHLALSINEEVLLVTMKNSQIYSLQLISSELKAEGSKFEQFAQPFHSGPVTGLDTCIRKPLLVTCSTDRSVHCWNYLDFTCELVKYFAEEAHSIALHPSGLYILVGFSDKLRLMNLLIDDIRSFREFPIRRCRECCFSHGGQYFAAVHGNVIQLYNTWTFELMGTFKGHNGKVRSLAWSPDDLRLISAGMEGAVYEWNIREMHRNSENVLKSCSYTCAVSAVDGNAIYAVGSDKSIKEIIDSQIVREIPSTAVLSQLVISHSGRMLFTATSQGTVRSIKFPFQLSETGECQEHQGHGGAVTRLRVSMDDQYLFSSSEDGSVMVWKISDRGAFTKKEKEIVYADEILVTKGDLEEKKNTMMELRSRVDELKMENEYQLRLKDMQLNERLHETTEKFQDEIEGLKMTSAVLKADKEKEELRHEEEMAEEINKHAKRMEELESSHSVKLMNEYEKYQDLQNKANYMEQQWQLQLDILKTEKQTTLQEFTTQYETTLRERQVEIDRVQEEIRQQKKEFKETTKESEEDGDLEIISLRYKYEKKLSEEREVGLRLKGENGIMKKKFNTLNSEIEAHKGEIQKALMEEKKLHSVIKSLEKDIAGLKKEILERDDKKRIYNWREEKNSEEVDDDKNEALK
ncbi:Cilia- and flagella-associated protein 57 [Coelomomyces lativittatus]|nr:Cilia- and flagella-associated protein 57 [Coelomomyces lativittatus]